ncbi:NYN domain-containing protein [Xanthomonas vesicatoria]|uniref:NYN domain-containing protein n=1 Tax=Xanthomonas vesicatoria TaxID=56460 RepID=A0ABS8LBV6_9XANT|nr:NYN domain-containing protein [Xanthomonas vesicatoria]MCC8623148.1 NYN domain-containing protein [Xanthomonas vesicatoria]MCC8694967.1 NYN domain-containing protein [Xanthomonas vesicatoria]MCC8702339.1 NYN domain-containing protein [Xanthomonas vesicatoria]
MVKGVVSVNARSAANTPCPESSFDGARIDYSKFVQHVLQGSDVLRTYYYDCPPYQSSHPTEEEAQRFAGKEKFFNALSRLPRFQVRQGKLERRGTAPNFVFQQKRVDILLGVDMVELAATRQIQKAILIAGDSDFVPAIEAVKRHGVLTVLWHGPHIRGPGNTVHDELWDQFDERFEIDLAVVAGSAPQQSR